MTGVVFGAEEAVDRAFSVARAWANVSPTHRSMALRAVADGLDTARDSLVAIATRESGLGTQRLEGEVGRTSGQLRLFAGVLDAGTWRDIVVDRARDDEPARPELVRFQQAMGPALVFAASNFPFAFSVLGGDSASALAAGCPVVLKVHPGHPETSRKTAEVAHEALESVGGPTEVLGLIEGEFEGVAALQDPRVTVAAFTGSLRGGRALAKIAADRPAPIPFYGELGSINPVFVTPGAASARGEGIAQGYVESFTLGVGQFCTKPGLLFIPSGSGIAEDAALRVTEAAGGRMLTERVHSGHVDGRSALLDVDGVEELAVSAVEDEAALVARPALLRVGIAKFLQHAAELTEECFGPTSIVVEYDDTEGLLAAVGAIDGSLTGTVHAEPDEVDLGGALVELVRARVGRLVWNGWPTGVAVSPAMQHGGPYPSTTHSQSTSVGTAAIERFCRPVAFQGVPAALLPADVRVALDAR